LRPCLEKDREEVEKYVKMLLSIPVGNQDDRSPLLLLPFEMLHPLEKLRPLEKLQPLEKLHPLVQLEEVRRMNSLTGLEFCQQLRQVWILAAWSSFLRKRIHG